MRVNTFYLFLWVNEWNLGFYLVTMIYADR